MTVIVELPAELEDRLKVAADQQGLDTNSFVKATLEDSLRTAQTGRDDGAAPEVVDRNENSMIHQRDELEPLPVLEGRLPSGWKDAIYTRP